MEPHPRARLAYGLRGLAGARAWWMDAASALLLAAIGAVSSPALSFSSGQFVYGVVVLGCCAAMLIRRRRPRTALSIMALFLLLHLAAVDEVGILPAVVCLVAAYTTQTQLAPPWRWGFLAATYAGAIAGILTTPNPALSQGWRSSFIATASVCAVLTVATLIGVLRRQTRERYDLAIERAAVLQAQQDTERRLAGMEERARITRDMHDILGHSLNTVAVQAEGARYILRTDPDRVDRALADIGRLSRSAVDEVRELIDVLPTEDQTPSRRPAPSLRDVPELIATLRGTDTIIRSDCVGDTAAVPSQVGLAAYRIVQESLTNAIRHAPCAPITIRTRVDAHSVSLLISNNAPNRAPQAADSPHGHGVTGMRERARLLGGTLDAGPDAGNGGWRVSADLPWGPA